MPIRDHSLLPHFPRIIGYQVLVSVMLLSAACSTRESVNPAAPPHLPIAVTYLLAEPVSMPMSLETIAQTEGAKEIDIRSRVGGILQQRFYHEGDTVAAGQPLFLIDPEPFQHALTEANALLREQRVRLERAGTEENRQRQLLAENFVSKRSHDLARADLAAAEAGLQAAKARTRQAELNLSYTSVTAPFSGVAGRSQFSEGALIAANSSLLTTLVQLSPIWVQFSFSDNELAALDGRLSEKNVHSATLILPDGSEYPQPGKINFAASTIDSRLGTQRLRAAFDNIDQRILPGQFVRVRITAGAMRRVFVVPQVAVMASEIGRYVYLISDDDTVKQQPVSAGDWLGSDWIILDGLQAGDRVVVDNLIKLTPGKTVTPQAAAATNVPHSDTVTQDQAP